MTATTLTGSTAALDRGDGPARRARLSVFLILDELARLPAATRGNPLLTHRESSDAGL